MSKYARVLLAACVLLVAVSIAAAAMFSCNGRVDASRPDVPVAAPTPVVVSPIPVAFDLEPDSPADL